MAGIPPQSPDPSGFSNYPRAPFGNFSPGNSPYQRPPGVYYDYIPIAWKLVQANLGVWVVSVLVAFAAMYAIQIPGTLITNLVLYGGAVDAPRGVFPSLSAILISMVIGLIPAACGQVVLSGLMYMGVKQARGEVIEIMDLFVGFRCFIPLAFGSLLMTLAIYLGFLLLIIPGFLVTGMLAFVPLLIIDRKMSVQDAFSECINKIGMKGFSIALLMIVTGLLAGLGICLFCVGILFTYPIYAVTMGLTYNNFFPPVASPGGYSHQIGQEPPRY